MTIRLKDKSGFTRHYRKIDYEEFAAALRAGDVMFYEDTQEEKAKRQTVWKAAKKLGVLVGKKVVAVYGEKELDGVTQKGYLFMVDEKS
jgi:hypothetical protein